MYTAYYTNPFSADDDATCYAEIDMNDDTTTTAAATTAADVARARSSSSPSQPPPRPQQPPPPPPHASTTTAATEERLRHQLDESEARHRATIAEYASHVDALRQQVDRLGAENNALYEERSRLETQVRALTLEKDNAEWVHHQEKERNEVLQRRVTELECELDRTRARAQEMVRELAHKYQSTHDATTAAPSRAQQAPPPPPLTPRRAGSNDNAAAATTPRSETAPQPQQQQQQHADAHAAPPRARLPAAMTDEERAEQRRREHALVEQLEAQLQTHSQRRDELTSELQRLEGARRRSAADRARRDTVEAALASTQHAIGRIKLQLRAHASLVK